MKNQAIEPKAYKLSKTGKSMLVGCKFSQFQSGLSFAWAQVPKGMDIKLKETILEGFNPTGTQPIMKDGVVQLHTDGTPVLKWVFA